MGYDQIVLKHFLGRLKMPAYNVHLNQFNGGEISPLLAGRFDLPKYRYSASVMQNCVALAEGALKKRGGTHFVSRTKNFGNEDEKVIPCPFVVSDKTAFTLSFCSGYIQFYAAHGLVLNDDDTPYEVVTPYNFADLYDEDKKEIKIQTIQCADVLYIFHEDFPPMTLTRYGNRDFRLDYFELLNGPWQMPNADENLVISASGSEGAISLFAAEPDKKGVNMPLSITAPVYSAYEQNSLSGSDYLQWYDGQELIASVQGVNFSSLADIVSRATTLFNNTAYFAGMTASYSGNTITIKHNVPSFDGKTITLKICYVTGTAVRFYDFPDYKYRVDNEHLVYKDYSVTIPALETSEDIFNAGDVGRLIRLNLENDETDAWYSGKTGISAGTILVSDGNYYIAQNSGTCGNVKPVHTKGNKSDGTIIWKYAHSGYGVVKITAVESGALAHGVVQSTLPENLSTSYWERGVIGPETKYPKSGAFWRNRLCLLIETDRGLEVYTSNSADYNNFADKTGGEVLDENSVSALVPSDKKAYGSWLCAGEALFIGTSVGIFYLSATSTAETFSPSNAKIDKCSSVGAKSAMPLQIDGYCLYIDSYGTNICGLSYSFEKDAYIPAGLSLYAKHLFSSGIVSFAYAEVPDKILWCLNGNGEVIGFTFNPEQQVIAFHRHEFKGKVKALTVIPSPDKNGDELWLSVQRNNDENIVRSVEYLDEGLTWQFPDDIESIRDLKARYDAETSYIRHNSFYVDGGVSFQRTAGSSGLTLAGLEHLKGREVAILANGAEQPRQTVSGEGAITINPDWENITVGLPIDMIFSPQIMYPQIENGGTFCPQKIYTVILMLFRSGSCELKGKYGNSVPILYRKSRDKMNNPTELFTGCKKVSFAENSSAIEDKGGEITITSDTVFPFNLLSLSYEMTV